MIVFGIAMAVLLLILRVIHWKFLLIDRSQELYSAGIAILFTTMGIWLASKLIKRNNSPLSADKASIGLNAIPNTLLSDRELEILLLISKGNTNQEIADELFLSLSTIKSHVSNIFGKLDVKNRTQALEKARNLKILQFADHTKV